MPPVRGWSWVPADTPELMMANFSGAACSSLSEQEGTELVGHVEGEDKALRVTFWLLWCIPGRDLLGTWLAELLWKPLSGLGTFEVSPAQQGTVRTL